MNNGCIEKTITEKGNRFDFDDTIESCIEINCPYISCVNDMIGYWFEYFYPNDEDKNGHIYIDEGIIEDKFILWCLDNFFSADYIVKLENKFMDKPFTYVLNEMLKIMDLFSNYIETVRNP